jgi:putative ABC transport system substrate-binding protein
MSPVRRRQILLSACALLAVPVAHAQRAEKVYRVALVFYKSPVSSMAGTEPAHPVARAFVHGLRDLGYVEGRNLVLIRRSLEGKPERASEVAAELVRLKVDVIVSATNVITRGAMKATSSIPIVMVVNGDPVGQGFVASLAHPGGNVTGTCYCGGIVDIDAKRLQLLREAAPKISRVAYVGTKRPWGLPAAERLRAAARAAGLTLFHADMAGGKVEPAFEAVLRERADALFVAGGAETYVALGRIVEFAAVHHLPAGYGEREAVKDGGLMSYGISAPGEFKYAATYVDKILRGANPADLPVQQPTKFELAINLKNAKALDLTIPESLLVQADEVIE